jgi:hypothetical protein
MARFAVVLFLSLVAAGQTHAASITNTDSAAVVIVLTEGGNKMQMVLDPGASETFCRSGCFITAPDGDRIGLDGGETIDIIKGSAVVK